MAIMAMTTSNSIRVKARSRADSSGRGRLARRSASGCIFGERRQAGYKESLPFPGEAGEDWALPEFDGTVPIPATLTIMAGGRRFVNCLL
jgi:hypothetical protein